MVTTSQSSNWQTASTLHGRQLMAWLLLLLTVVITFLFPQAFPILILLPIVAVASVMVTIQNEGHLRRLMMAAWGATILTALIPRWMMPILFPAPTIVVMTGLVVVTSLVFYLLWRRHQRFVSLLATTRMLSGFEEEVEERSTTLQRLITDLEVRTETQKALRNELQQSTQELKLLNKISQIRRSVHTLAGAQDQMAELVAQLFMTETSGALSIGMDEGKGIRTVSTWGEVSVEPYFFADDCWALREEEAHLFTPKTTGQSFCRHLHHTGALEYLCIPLKSHDQTLGVLHLRALPGKTLSQEMQKLAQVVAEQVALVLGNLQLTENLRLQAVCDPLTGLYNRRYMEESLKRELIKASSRSQHPMGVIMIDLDEFQDFNERFGYSKGDQLLRELGTFFQSTIRGGDIACRYRGDEFVLILPGASLEVTQQRAEQLCKGVRQLKAQQDYTPNQQVTLSLGVASFPHNGVTADALLRASSFALERARETGGSCVMVASSSF